MQTERRWVCERQTERAALRFKAHRLEADWLTEGGQENHWTRVMMSVLTLTAWETGSHVKKKKGLTGSRHMSDYSSSLSNLCINFISVFSVFSSKRFPDIQQLISSVWFIIM